MQLFQTNHIDAIKHCLQIFYFQLPSALIPERLNKFAKRYHLCKVLCETLFNMYWLSFLFCFIVATNFLLK